MRRPLRILYAAGPGNVAGTYAIWKAGHDDPSQVAVTYSRQFYDVARDLGARVVVIGWNFEPAQIRDGNFRIEHRPFPRWAGRGLPYHATRAWWALRVVATAIAARVDVAVISTSDRWWLFRPLRWTGITVVPTLHCVLRAKSRTDAPSLLERMNIRFLGDSAAVMAVSHDVADQLRTLADKPDLKVHVFVPHYRRQSFHDIAPPPLPRKPFRVFFAGRIQRNKGVFDLLDVARRYSAAGRDDIEFDLCGGGPALDELRRETQNHGLGGRFRCHGHLHKQPMRDMYARSHVVIVPTTTDFIEGFNKVVAEAVLAGRPVITSSVCPALSSVRDAVIEVPPDDVKAYGDAILNLCDDAALYEAKRRGCEAAQEQFYDSTRSWADTLKRVLAEVGALETLPAMPATAEGVGP